MNWFRSVEYSRAFGVKSESVAPVGLALLLSAAVALYLGFRCVRCALARLESGTPVGAGRWIESWTVLLYACPLLWHRTSGSSWIEADGALATATGGYGHPLSNWIFLWAVGGLLLFQILARLKDDDQAPMQPTRRTRFARG